jgi:hypothetical protein
MAKSRQNPMMVESPEGEVASVAAQCKCFNTSHEHHKGKGVYGYRRGERVLPPLQRCEEEGLSESCSYKEHIAVR